MRAALLPLLALLALPGPAAAQMEAVRRDDWAAAEIAAARHADPVASKLVRYYRLLAPGAAPAGEIAEFRRENPDWPAQTLLARRWEEAVAAIVDDGVVIRTFTATPPQTDAGRLRLAEALDRAGDRRAGEAIRTAWVESTIGPAAENDFLGRYGTRLTPDAQWQRFQRLAWAGSAQATAQATRLDPARQAVAEVWLGLKRNDPDAPARRAALPAAQRAEPGLVLEHARFLRRAGRETEAADLLQAQGPAAQKAAPERAGAFWAERHLLARRLLRANEPQAAYALAAGHGLAESGDAVEAEFLAGWIALRQLNDPRKAELHFNRLGAMSQAAITQGRALYWQGRAAAARNDTATATARYQAAAAWVTTYYGQLASLALGEGDAGLARRIRAAHDPATDPDRLASFAGRELTRAAALLIGWDEPRRARFFLLRLAELAPDPVDRALAARLATGMGRPELAVWVARRAGTDGTMLPETGWPMPYAPPSDAVEPALAYAIMRQESNFEPDAVSPAGARGLMQLMPGTARAVARKLGTPTTVPRLTADTDHNMQLGTTYLRQVLDEAEGCVPCAAASYNAGPGRTRAWLVTYGDPRAGQADMIDWIETIPFNETRNYVQRVIENMVIYRARRGETKPHPLADWLR